MKTKILLIALMVASGVLAYSFINSQKQVKTETPIVGTEVEPGGEPYQVTEVVSGLNRPWGISFLPNDQIIFTQRINKVSLLIDGTVTDLNPPSDTFVNGEGGMMAVAVDPEFEQNKFVYLCFNSKDGDEEPRIVVTRYQLDVTQNRLSERVDIIPDLPANPSGRHSGCQLEFGPDGYLWVGTGDIAKQETPQSPTNLGGKILRVDRDGNGAPGNLGGEFDNRVYSYGHRNTQGLGFFSNPGYSDLLGISIEHGPNSDDEVNLLRKGNFGWDPLPFYGEAVPMTDTKKFPDAVEAIWSSGFPTIAAAGGTVINSEIWGEWTNAIAVAALKGSHIMILEIDTTGTVTNETVILKNDFGRFRTIREAPDGSLYILTDNGEADDKILRMGW